MNKKGFTLVELIISIAISFLVFGAVAAFMGQSTRNYRRSNDEISLQLEAQFILNQLNNLILEANNVKFDTGTHTLKIKQSDCVYLITLDQAEHSLKMEKVLPLGSETGNKVLFGRYVDSYSVMDTGINDRNKEIKVRLFLKNNDMEYVIEQYVIKLRNEINAMDHWEGLSYD